MKTPAHFDWCTFLQQVSRDMLKDDSVRKFLSTDVIASGWLGYEGATEADVTALEDRLQANLPRSYRDFLLMTNGWRNCGPFIYNLWPCAEVRWFRERNQPWIDAYVNPQLPPGMKLREPRPLTNEEHLNYGDDQDSCRFPTEYLKTALEISDVGDAAILLLNPKIVTASGEWEAWFFANWNPGAHRYRSFVELMQGEHKSFLRLRADAASNQGPAL